MAEQILSQDEASAMGVPSAVRHRRATRLFRKKMPPANPFPLNRSGLSCVFESAVPDLATITDGTSTPPRA